MSNNLVSHIDLLHTTKLGEERIIKNLGITGEVINYLKKKILDNKANIYKRGKNYYCEIDNIIITINSHNYCVITAHKTNSGVMV